MSTSSGSAWDRAGWGGGSVLEIKLSPSDEHGGIEYGYLVGLPRPNL
jgi:hypothetical protein